MEIDINKVFKYYKPAEKQIDKYTKIRQTAKDYASLIIELVPEVRERDIALQKLEEVVMWSNAGIARFTSAIEEDLEEGQGESFNDK